MKIIVAYNKHRHGGGSDVVAQQTIDLLARQPGFEVLPFLRDSRELKGLSGKVRALVSGCYAREAVRSFSKLLDAERPDLVHAQEIYPLISPWIFKACSEKGVPVVMTSHDYRMSCPVVTHFRDHMLCYECPEHSELRCIKHNCCGSMTKSIAYAARNVVGRKKRLFMDCVDLFLTPSEKAKEILCRYSGISPDKVVAVGNPVAAAERQQAMGIGHQALGEKLDSWYSAIGDRAEREGQEVGDDGQMSEGEEPQDSTTINQQLSSPTPSAQRPTPHVRDYIAYAGRFEPEKGFDLLVEALAGTGLRLRVAGDSSAYLARGRKVPDYVDFAGHLDRDGMNQFYAQARMLVVPSLWHETFGLVVAEALSCGTPVIVSDLGALAEVAGPGGLTVPAGDAAALRDAIIRLWNDESLCSSLAEAGREHVKRYSNEKYVQNLLYVYEKVLGVGH